MLTYTASAKTLHPEASLRQFDREFKAEYQPLMSLERQSFVGFEARLAWQQQRQALYSLAALQMVDETGLSLTMRDWLLRTVIGQLYFWKKQFPTPASWVVSLQLSQKQWLTPGLLKTLQVISEDFSWHIQGLILEVDYAVLNQSVQWSAQLVQQLQHRGIGVQVCNFVPTHSALATLMHYSIQSVKVDPEFIRNLVTSSAARICFEGILTKSCQQQISITLPRIESPEQLSLLTQLRGQNWRTVCAAPIGPKEATLLVHADSKLARSHVTTYLAAMNRLSQFVQKYLGLTVVCQYWHKTCPTREWLMADALTWQQSGQFHSADDFYLSAGQIQDLELWVHNFFNRCRRILRNLPALIDASSDLTVTAAQLLRLQTL